MTAVMANRDSIATPSGKTQKELKSRIPPGCSSNPVKLDKKPFPMTGVLVHETQPPDGSVFRPMPQTMDNVSQHQDYTGPACVRFDDQGMILPHSILGNLEGFRKYLESKGDTELLRHVPDHRRDHPAETRVQKGMLVEECSALPPGHIHTQSNSLEHWNTCIKQRRCQEDFLSGVLHRPVENLLMNQGDRFRQIQEQKEILSQVLPTIQSGYGYRVGSEFWSLPQHYGDEKSGITATLTRTEQGVREAVARVGRPFITRQELGNVGAELSRPSAQAWIHSEYLEKQHRELREVLADLDYNPPDIDGLAGKPITYITVCEIPSLDEDKEEAAPREEEINHDPLARSDDIMLDTLLIPALRFCGQSAHWTGSSTSHQGEVGISVRMNFEALTGERASSHLELHNEGSTAVYYSWQQLQLPCSFPTLVAQTTTPHFYFNSSTAVILQGDTQRVEFTFKSEVPGIKRELWQLNTHPVLLGGASMQVTLRGLAVYQDTMAEKRHAIEMELQRRVAEKTCQSLLYELLQGVGSPERCSSPADLYITEEQEFLCRNPKLQYHFEPIQALKRLWQEVSPGSIWNLSVHTLRQAVLSLPEKQLDSAQDSLTRDRGLCQLNSLLLELSRPLLQHAPLTSVTIGRQLWRELLDRMAAEAVRLRQLLGLPETDTWTEQSQHPQITDAYSEDKLKKQEKTEKRGGMAATEEEEKKGDKKGASKSAKEKLPEERSKKGRGALEGGKQLGGKQGEKDQALTIDQQHPRSDHSIRPEIRDKYRRLLHQQVHVLMGGLVDSLCDLVEELKEGDTFVKNIV